MLSHPHITVRHPPCSRLANPGERNTSKIVPNGMKLDGSTMHFPVISITLMLTSISVFPNWGSVDCGPAYIVRVVSVFIVFVFFAFPFF